MSGWFPAIVVVAGLSKLVDKLANPPIKSGRILEVKITNC
jgi:hypothetical protein